MIFVINLYFVLIQGAVEKGYKEDGQWRKETTNQKDARVTGENGVSDQGNYLLTKHCVTSMLFVSVQGQSESHASDIEKYIQNGTMTKTEIACFKNCK